MSARDELATIVHKRICEDSLSDCLEDGGYCVKASSEILAAGYSKPRTITTVEDLDALGVGAVVRSYICNVYIKDYDLYNPADSFWVAGGSVSEYQSNRIMFPATVLYEAAK